MSTWDGRSSSRFGRLLDSLERILPWCRPSTGNLASLTEVSAKNPPNELPSSSLSDAERLEAARNLQSTRAIDEARGRDQ